MDKIDWLRAPESQQVPVPIFLLFCAKMSADEYQVWNLIAWLYAGLNRPVKWDMKTAVKIIEIPQKRISTAIRRLEVSGWLMCSRPGLTVEPIINLEEKKIETLKSALTDESIRRKMAERHRVTIRRREKNNTPGAQ